jgi:hypothetical protein
MKPLMATITPSPFIVDFEKIYVEKCKNPIIYYLKSVISLAKKKEDLSILLT